MTRRSPPAPSDVSDLRGRARRRLLLRAVAAAAAAAFLCTMVASAAIGGLAGPTRKAPRCTKTTGVGTGLAVVIRNASAGATICLNSGSYGAVTFRSLSKSADVTVRPAAGANVTIGEVDLQVVRHLRFTGLGGRMSVAGAEVDDSNTRPKCSSHLTFDHLRFTRGMDVHARCAAMAILVDHVNLNNVLGTGAGEGRINVIGGWPNAVTSDQGVTISNSTFNGGCSKGMQLLGDSYGVQILYNEFANLSQSGCDPIHIGGIQLYGAEHTHLKGNYFHDNGDSAGGLSIVTDGVHHGLIENNVWVCTCIYPWSIQAAAMRNTTVRHNTFAGGGGLHFYISLDRIAFRNVIRDNVFTDPSNGITWDSATGPTAWGTQDHNLNAGVPGHGNLKGRPAFVGGKKPKSYQDYRLARGSRGKGAASDGGDLGIRARR